MDVYQLIKNHEGIRLKPYRDTEGNLTIGVGRNLDGKGISMDEAIDLFNHDLAEVTGWLKFEPWYVALDDVRQAAIQDMAFDLNKKIFEFKTMILALSTKNWSLASDSVLNSLFATQVPNRAADIAYMLRTGLWP